LLPNAVQGSEIVENEAETLYRPVKVMNNELKMVPNAVQGSEIIEKWVPKRPVRWQMALALGYFLYRSYAPGRLSREIQRSTLSCPHQAVRLNPLLRNSLRKAQNTIRFWPTVRSLAVAAFVLSLSLGFRV
jgi:hypothetical protein